MVTTDTIEADASLPYFPVLLTTWAEAALGNGIKANGDLQVTATATDLEIQVAAGTWISGGAETSLGSSTTKTLSSGGTDDRYDTIAWDTGSSSVVVKEGTEGTAPVAPMVSGDEVLLAVVYVASGATDVADSDIYNWRPRAQRAEDTAYDDSTGQYSAATVDAALDELQEAAQVGAYPLANSDLANDAVTVTAGRLLTGGGSVSLGGSTTVDYQTDAAFEGREGGPVPDADQGIVCVDSLADGETVEVYKATLTLGTIAAAPTGLDLELVTFDNAGGFTSRATIIAGDGATVHDRVSGDPLGSYTNSSGGEQSIGVVVDNQTGSEQEVFALVEGAAPTN